MVVLGCTVAAAVAGPACFQAGAVVVSGGTAAATLRPTCSRAGALSGVMAPGAKAGLTLSAKAGTAVAVGSGLSGLLWLSSLSGLAVLALGSVGSIGALQSLGPLQFLGSIGSLGSLQSLGALGAVWALIPFRIYGCCRPMQQSVHVRRSQTIHTGAKSPSETRARCMPHTCWCCQHVGRERALCLGVNPVGGREPIIGSEGALWEGVSQLGGIVSRVERSAYSHRDRESGSSGIEWGRLYAMWLVACNIRGVRYVWA